MDHEKILVYVIVMILGMGLFAIFQKYCIELSTAGWTFTGHEFIAGFIPVLPLFFIISLIAIPVYFIAKEVAD